MNHLYQPDPTWELWVKSRDEYVQLFVHEGRFHAGVPEDVVKDYRIAEHLMAGAWYHYPMYDEALRKILGIVEMAVKLRCREKGIATGRFRLVQLIDQLYGLERREEIKNMLHMVREVRNSYAHPERYGFAGIVLSRGVVPLLNLLNRLFLSDDELATAEAAKIKIQEQIPAAALYVLHWQRQRYLICRIELVGISAGNESLWVFYTMPQELLVLLPAGKYPEPMILGLRDVTFNGQELAGVELVKGEEVRLVPTDEAANVAKLAAHEQDLALVGAREQQTLANWQRQKVTEAFHAFQHRYFWNAGFTS